MVKRFWAPWLLLAQDCIEDVEGVSGDGGDHLRLSGGEQPVAEGLEEGVVTGRREGADQ
jgi:hypothetical protein